MSKRILQQTMRHKEARREHILTSKSDSYLLLISLKFSTKKSILNKMIRPLAISKAQKHFSLKSHI